MAGTVPAQTWGTHKNETLLCVGDRHANASIDVDLSPTIKVGGGPDLHSAVTSNGADVYPTLNATDAGKGFSNNQAIYSGELILDRTDQWT